MTESRRIWKSLATYFQSIMKSSLAILGIFLLSLGLLLFLYLLWNSVSANRLDGLPIQYSELTICQKPIDGLQVVDKVVSVDAEIIVVAQPAMEYLAQDCKTPVSFTITAPGLETALPKQVFTVVTENSWEGGVWLLKAKRVGVFQVTISDGTSVFTTGISVMPNFLGLSLEYSFLQNLSGLVFMIGILCITWSLKKNSTENFGL